METYGKVVVQPYAILDVGIGQTFVVSLAISPLYTRDNYPFRHDGEDMTLFEWNLR